MALETPTTIDSPRTLERNAVETLNRDVSHVGHSIADAVGAIRRILHLVDSGDEDSMGLRDSVGSNLASITALTALAINDLDPNVSEAFFAPVDQSEFLLAGGYLGPDANNALLGLSRAVTIEI